MGALSLVMHVWLGISRNSSRRSVHTGLSTMGIREHKARSLAPIVRPSRKHYQALVLPHDLDG